MNKGLREGEDERVRGCLGVVGGWPVQQMICRWLQA